MKYIDHDWLRSYVIPFNQVHAIWMSRDPWTGIVDDWFLTSANRLDDVNDEEEPAIPILRSMMSAAFERRRTG